MSILHQMANVAKQEIDCIGGLRNATINPTILGQLKEKRDTLLLQLKDCDDAIKALEQNPEFVKCLELLGRVR